MKKLILALVLSTFGIDVNAQNTAVKFAPIDASPLDIAYYPVNVAKAKKDDTSMPIIKVLYSRPAKKGREIFGVLEQFDKVWRLGANESTEISFNKAVTVGNKKLKPGKYSLFAIPNKDKWTIIINKQTDRWGAFTYDQTKDVVRVDMPVSKLEKAIEVFSITFADSSLGANLVMAWDTTQVILPMAFKK
ncbi:DUF2911 domain-containing protein [Pedobacter insulae]|uniref:DUF2911 domain-containing protein n=1 Tax=Pedobacter insulae TaxID=414048 RepID=A0A1I2XMS6_9SPHI|nr:DUF2911 domain-containing protein [Pedobacter insulae]SFH13381.1 Protein of unknown function [Pedobacter insulae]